jgi:hypothetical protein
VPAAAADLPDGRQAAFAPVLSLAVTKARRHELAQQSESRACGTIACGRGVVGRRGDCDRWPSVTVTSLAIDGELIAAYLEVVDPHFVGQTRHRDHAVVVGERDVVFFVKKLTVSA